MALTVSIDMDAQASHHISHLKEYAKSHPGCSVVLYARVSAEYQRVRLPMQKIRCKMAIEELGCLYLKSFSDVCTGKDFDDRIDFFKAIEYAKEHNAVLASESTCRYLRPKNYSHTNQTATPTKEQYEELTQYANGVELTTIAHPDGELHEIRSRQTMRGIVKVDGKRRMLGSYKSKGKSIPLILELHKDGLSLRQIVVEISKQIEMKVSHMYVSRCIKEWSKK